MYYESVYRALFVLAVFALGAAGLAQSPATKNDYGERFDTAWYLVEERYWDGNYGGANWQALRLEYRPKALAASSERAFYGVLERLYDHLGDGHSTFVPPAKVQKLRQAYGDLPCLGVFGAAQTNERRGHVRYRLDGQVGILTLPDLATPGVAGDLREAVQRLAREGASAFVLDLRGNPGGRLIEMMEAAGIFTRGFLWRTLTRWTLPIPYPALGRVETERPLAILIDKGVNSAAEGLAGALQSRGRARLFGQTSAGNVEAVLPFCLRDGSQAWIATGVLAPLGGSTWEGRGVVPDERTHFPLRDALAYLRSL